MTKAAGELARFRVRHLWLNVYIVHRVVVAYQAADAPPGMKTGGSDRKKRGGTLMMNVLEQINQNGSRTTPAPTISTIHVS